MSSGNVSADQLKNFVERIERLLEERQGIQDDVKDTYAEAKANGYDVKVLREIIKLRKQERHVRQEHEAVLEVYKNALGID